ncbi:hypothetical protein BDY19DRAFT_992873 [Irpex rosettiformis]|uniref:Uncharacterized protein n=1 Tax=Irpex rosettiformis TaxID=378272 RepID=A0ACB8U6N4_9APHY|nr:hypothetical protein BDY19DRAFT_992873 [Irpex rosettiformis]
MVNAFNADGHGSTTDQDNGPRPTTQGPAQSHPAVGADANANVSDPPAASNSPTSNFPANIDYLLSQINGGVCDNDGHDAIGIANDVPVDNSNVASINGQLDPNLAWDDHTAISSGSFTDGHIAALIEYLDHESKKYEGEKKGEKDLGEGAMSDVGFNLSLPLGYEQSAQDSSTPVMALPHVSRIPDISSFIVSPPIQDVSTPAQNAPAPTPTPTPTPIRSIAQPLVVTPVLPAAQIAHPPNPTPTPATSNLDGNIVSSIRTQPWPVRMIPPRVTPRYTMQQTQTRRIPSTPSQLPVAVSTRRNLTALPVPTRVDPFSQNLFTSPAGISIPENLRFRCLENALNSPSQPHQPVSHSVRNPVQVRTSATPVRGSIGPNLSISNPPARQVPSAPPASKPARPIPPPPPPPPFFPESLEDILNPRGQLRTGQRLDPHTLLPDIPLKDRTVKMLLIASLEYRGLRAEHHELINFPGEDGHDTGAQTGKTDGVTCVVCSTTAKIRKISRIPYCLGTHRQSQTHGRNWEFILWLKEKSLQVLQKEETAAKKKRSGQRRYGTQLEDEDEGAEDVVDAEEALVPSPEIHEGSSGLGRDQDKIDGNRNGNSVEKISDEAEAESSTTRKGKGKTRATSADISSWSPPPPPPQELPYPDNNDNDVDASNSFMRDARSSGINNLSNDRSVSPRTLSMLLNDGSNSTGDWEDFLRHQGAMLASYDQATSIPRSAATVARVPTLDTLLPSSTDTSASATPDSQSTTPVTTPEEDVGQRPPVVTTDATSPNISSNKRAPVGRSKPSISEAQEAYTFVPNVSDTTDPTSNIPKRKHALTTVFGGPPRPRKRANVSRLSSPPQVEINGDEILARIMAQRSVPKQPALRDTSLTDVRKQPQDGEYELRDAHDTASNVQPQLDPSNVGAQAPPDVTAQGALGIQQNHMGPASGMNSGHQLVPPHVPPYLIDGDFSGTIQLLPQPPPAQQNLAGLGTDEGFQFIPSHFPLYPVDLDFSSIQPLLQLPIAQPQPSYPQQMLQIPSDEFDQFNEELSLQNVTDTPLPRTTVPTNDPTFDDWGSLPQFNEFDFGQGPFPDLQEDALN